MWRIHQSAKLEGPKAEAQMQSHCRHPAHHQHPPQAEEAQHEHRPFQNGKEYERFQKTAPHGSENDRIHEQEGEHMNPMKIGPGG